METYQDRLVSTPISEKESSVSDQKLNNSNRQGRESGLVYSCSVEYDIPPEMLNESITTPHVKNPFLGYLFMMVAVFGLTCVHIFSKIAFTRKPTLTNVDCTLFMGICLTVVYFIWSRLAGVQLSLTSDDSSHRRIPNKALLALGMSMIATVSCNLCMFKGLSMISVGKSTLIFSTNPMFSMILSYFLLGDKVTKAVIFSTIGAFVGIYFLSINKNNAEDESHVIIGIILVVLGAWFQAIIFVAVRIVSVCNINFLVRPFYVGVTFLLFSGLTTCFYREGITFETYDLIDVILLTCLGLGSCTCVGPLSLAMKYESASKLSPILYMENILTLMSDAVLFHYHFISYDYLGISIVSVCLCIPAFLRIKNEAQSQNVNRFQEF